MGAVATTALCALLALASVAVAAPPERHHAAQDLRYGESLYHYYLGDFPQALSVLLRAESDGAIVGHQHYPKLMRAGIYMAYGLPDRARSEFAAQLSQGEPQAVRDTAHYYLAQLDYRAGDYAKAAASANSIGHALDDTLADNNALLNVHLFIKTGPPATLQEAQTILSPLRHNRALALLNLANAAARAGDVSGAQQYYRAGLSVPLPKSGAKRDEALAIRDKTLTAMGYSFLQEANYASAKAAFRDVRLDSNLANSALLGYGWAAASYQDYPLALKPWQELRRRSLLLPAVQETLLAVPWAYEQLNAPRSALLAYRESEQLLSTEFARIEQQLERLNRHRLMAGLRHRGAPGQEHRPPAADALLARGDSHELQSWLSLDQVDVLSSDSHYLQTLLKQDALQQQAQQLRDLLQLQSGLNHWHSKLDIYRQLVTDKRQLRSQRSAAIEQSGLLQQHRALQQQREQLAGELARIEREQDTLALADADTRAQAARIARARTSAAGLTGNPKVPDNAAQRLRFYQGVIDWRAAQGFAEHLWQARKTLAQLDAALGQSRQRSQQVADILSTDPDLEAQLTRLTALQTRTHAQLTHLEQAIHNATDALLQRLRQTLQQHHQRLQDYLSQVRLSIARLYDVAYRAAQESEPEAPVPAQVQP